MGVLEQVEVKDKPGVVGGCEKLENGIGVGGGVISWTGPDKGVVSRGEILDLRGIERGLKLGSDFFGGVEGGLGGRIRDLARRGRDEARKGILVSLCGTVHPT